MEIRARERARQDGYDSKEGGIFRGVQGLAQSQRQRRWTQKVAKRRTKARTEMRRWSE